MKKLIYLISLIICLNLMVIPGGFVLAEESVNEDELFAGETTVVDNQEVINDDLDEELKQKRIGFSGEVSSTSRFTSYSIADDWTGMVNEEEKVDNQITADFYLDIRFTGGVKSFLSIEASYSDITTEKDIDLMTKEFFLDTNWQNKIYFRTGKQVLKWGRSYFWNPTDLINLEKKDFFDLDEGREGVYGIKAHLPSGTRKNGYFFIKIDDINVDQSEKLENASLVGKYEFLIGKTEMSFSAWAKDKNKPVFGYDFSSRVFEFDIQGELSISKADLYQKMDYDTLELVKENDKVIPRASLGVTKYFNHGDINDRISLTGEFYYNGNGYEANIFDRLKDESVLKKGEYISEVYQPFMNSKYYFAVFSSVQKFLDPDLTLNINGISNLVDHSGILTCGISYNPSLTNFYFDLNVDGYFGDDNTEATFKGEKTSVSLGLKVLF